MSNIEWQEHDSGNFSDLPALTYGSPSLATYKTYSGP
jgi:hypothetical protein